MNETRTVNQYLVISKCTFNYNPSKVKAKPFVYFCIGVFFILFMVLVHSFMGIRILLGFTVKRKVNMI